MELICYASGKGEYPENTIEGIKNCQSVNPNCWVEIDLQFTKDNKIVLLHDNNLKRTTGIDAKVNELTLLQIKQLNAAYNFKKDKVFIYRESKLEIPTLDEIFLQFPRTNFLLDVHSKNSLIINELIHLLEKYSRKEDQFIVVSKYHLIKKKFKRKKPNYCFGASAREVKILIIASFFGLEDLLSVSSNIIMMPMFYKNKEILTQRILDYVKKIKLKIWVWFSEGIDTETVNSIGLFTKLKKKEVDGIFTSFPTNLILEIESK